jgi:hypothetical protein
MTGVSGGGGEPLWALVVDVEAVELRRLIPDGSRWELRWLGSVTLGDLAPGGGQYCWW